MKELFKGRETFVYKKAGNPLTSNILGGLKMQSGGAGEAARQAQMKGYSDSKAAKRTPPKHTPKNRPREPSDKDEDESEEEEELD